MIDQPVSPGPGFRDWWQVFVLRGFFIFLSSPGRALTLEVARHLLHLPTNHHRIVVG